MEQDFSNGFEKRKKLRLGFQKTKLLFQLIGGGANSKNGHKTRPGQKMKERRIDRHSLK